MTKVKICGLQRPIDALVAAEAGADFVGMVFVPERHRRLDIEAAREIAKSFKSTTHVPQVVGLFADQPVDEVNSIVDACGLDLAQLCGKESLEYCRQVKTQVIKVVHVDASATGPSFVTGLAKRLGTYIDAGQLVTLDRLVEGIQGGTGHSFSWDIAAQLAQQGHSFLLAGGLSPENVAQAVAQVSPWGVDVSSGVETDGAKDHRKIRAFINNAKERSTIGDQQSVTGP